MIRYQGVAARHPSPSPPLYTTCLDPDDTSSSEHRGWGVHRAFYVESFYTVVHNERDIRFLNWAIERIPQSDLILNISIKYFKNSIFIFFGLFMVKSNMSSTF